MESLGRDILTSVEPGSARAGLEVGLRVRRVWAEALGKPLADELRVGKVERGVLTVMTRSSAWLSEARFLAGRVLEALHKADPGLSLARVEFRMDRSAPGPSPAGAEAPERRPLGEDERGRIQALVEAVRDPHLKESLARLFEKAATRKPGGPPAGTGPDKP